MNRHCVISMLLCVLLILYVTRSVYATTSPSESSSVMRDENMSGMSSDMNQLLKVETNLPDTFNQSMTHIPLAQAIREEKKKSKSKHTEMNNHQLNPSKIYQDNNSLHIAD